MKKRIIVLMLVMLIFSIFPFNVLADTTDRPDASRPDDGDEPFKL